MKAIFFFLLDIISMLAPGLMTAAFAMGIRELFQDWKASREAKNKKSAEGLQTQGAAGKRGNSNQ